MPIDAYSWPPRRATGAAAAPMLVDALPPLEASAEAATYVPHPDLVHAINLALLLGKPLLVTGEPGTGKTKLAESIAWQLDYNGPFKFTAKSNSQARDLFYQYDALGRFQASQLEKADAGAAAAPRPRGAIDFIEYTALGKAILLAHPLEQVKRLLAGPGPETARQGWRIDPDGKLQHPGPPSRSVVVIDEIDKAPRDFPNDILDEIENMRFRVPELNDLSTPPVADARMRPVVVITSNQERQLPEPFLRRCIFFEIPFPERRLESHAGGDGYFVEDIVARRVANASANFVRSDLCRDAIELFMELRNLPDPLRKRPSTAELIDWLNALVFMGGNPSTGLRQQSELGLRSLPALLKGGEDLARGREVFTRWAFAPAG